MKILGACLYNHVHEGRCEGVCEREIDRDREREREYSRFMGDLTMLSSCGTYDVMKILGAYMYMHVYEGGCVCVYVKERESAREYGRVMGDLAMLSSCGTVRRYQDTGWRRLIGSITFIGHFQQK